jgi:hypothetical protein
VTPRGDGGGAAPDARLLEILRAERRALGPDELAQRSGLPVNTVKRALGKLVRDRQARRAGGGLFVFSARAVSSGAVSSRATGGLSPAGSRGGRGGGGSGGDAPRASPPSEKATEEE